MELNSNLSPKGKIDFELVCKARDDKDERAYAELMEVAADTRDKDAVLLFLAELEQRLYEKYPTREMRLEKMRQQYSRLNSTLAVQRKYWNKKGEHPPVGSPWHEQVKEWEKLRSELKMMGELS